MVRSVPVGRPQARVYWSSVLTGKDRVDITNLVLRLQTNKSVGAPGSFALDLSPQETSQLGGLTPYEAIGPNDFIEIQLGSGMPRTSIYGGLRGTDPLITVFRGFVDKVVENRQYEGDEVDVQHSVMGRDMSKVLFYTVHHYFRGDSVIAQSLGLAGGNSFLAKLGRQQSGGWTLEDLIKTVVDNLNNDQTVKIKGKPQRRIGNLSLLNSRQPRVPILGIQLSNNSALTNFRFQSTLLKYQGTLWDFLNTWAGYPWHEMVIQDYPSFIYGFPVLSVRPTPFLFGEFSLKPQYNRAYNDVQVGADDVDPRYKVTTIDSNLIRSFQMERSDEDTYTYFLTSPVFSFTGYNANESRPLMFKDNAHINEYFLKLYGYRPAQFETYFTLNVGGSDDQTDPAKKAQRDADVRTLGERCKLLNDIVSGWNSLNPLLESGTAICSLHEEILPGHYVSMPETYGKGQISKGRLNTDSQGRDLYVQGVSHSWAAFGDSYTELRLTRGNGYLNAIKDTPYRFGIPDSNDLTNAIDEIFLRYIDAVNEYNKNNPDKGVL